MALFFLHPTWNTPDVLVSLGCQTNLDDRLICSADVAPVDSDLRIHGFLTQFVYHFYCPVRMSDPTWFQSKHQVTKRKLLHVTEPTHSCWRTMCFDCTMICSSKVSLQGNTHTKQMWDKTCTDVPWGKEVRHFLHKNTVKILSYFWDMSMSWSLVWPRGPANRLRLLIPRMAVVGWGIGWYTFLKWTSRSSWCSECSRTWLWSRFWWGMYWCWKKIIMTQK